MSFNPLRVTGFNWVGPRRLADLEGQLAAVNKSQAVIEFDPDGTVRKANENFLQAVGYTLAEIRGKHHSMFVDPLYRESQEYRAFWARLGRGEFDAGECKRLAKGGREIRLQATYNPIFDAPGTALQGGEVRERHDRDPVAKGERGRADRGHQQGAGPSSSSTWTVRPPCRRKLPDALVLERKDGVGWTMDSS
jgi:PAS domain S-box-containing protein